MNQEDCVKTPEVPSVASVAKGSAAKYWRTIVEEQRTSGLSVAAFCQQRGLTASSLFAWRRRLQGNGPVQHANAKSSKARPSTFAEVNVQARRQVPEVAPAACLELRLRGDRSVVVPRGFDRQHLMDLLAALEALP
jgi:transposase-like protein